MKKQSFHQNNHPAIPEDNPGEEVVERNLKEWIEFAKYSHTIYSMPAGVYWWWQYRLSEDWGKVRGRTGINKEPAAMLLQQPKTGMTCRYHIMLRDLNKNAFTEGWKFYERKHGCEALKPVQVATNHPTSQESVEHTNLDPRNPSIQIKSAASDSTPAWVGSSGFLLCGIVVDCVLSSKSMTMMRGNEYGCGGANAMAEFSFLLLLWLITTKGYSVGWRDPGRKEGHSTATAVPGSSFCHYMQSSVGGRSFALCLGTFLWVVISIST